MIRIYLAEDSPTTARLLQSLLEAPDLTVVGVGRDGLEAKAGLQALAPDILVTDLIMPNLDGYELIQWVMATRPVPIVVLSSSIHPGDSELVMRCLELGAMEARAKPNVNSPEDLASARETFQGLVRALAKVRPIRRTPRPAAAPLKVAPSGGRPPELLLLGASTGGPQAVLELLRTLGPGFPLPAVLALHMEPGYMEGLGRWLGSATGWAIEQQGQVARFRPGTLYLPPEGRHLLLDGQGGLRTQAPDPADRMVPSVDRLFKSAVHLGSRVAAVLMTGMGRDGAAGLLAIREAGGLTLAQDEASSVVFGMPMAARDLHACRVLLDPEGLAAYLQRAVAGTERTS